MPQPNNVLLGTAIDPKPTRVVLMLPMWFFQLYLTMTVLVFAFGPWPWPVPTPPLLYLFLIYAQVALWLGYKFGLRADKGGYYSRIKLDALIKISLTISIIWILPNFMLRLGIESLDYSLIVEAIAKGFINPAEMYAARAQAMAEIQKTPFIGYIALLLYPVLWLTVPLAVFYWERLGRNSKLLFIFYVTADILSWVAIGTNKGIAEFFALSFCLIIARKPTILTAFNPARWAKILIIFFVGVTVIFTFFTTSMTGRGKGSIPMEDRASHISADRNNWMLCLLNEDAQGAVAAATSYMGQGYYALGLALNEPFDWSYGVGNSYYLTGLSKIFIGQSDVADRTYPAKTEKFNLDRFVYWHSFYSWIASDLTFPGTIVFVFLIGRLFAMAWIDVLGKQNPFAVAFFALLLIMLFYFPANNQVFAFANTANAFFVILPLWLLTRKRYKLFRSQER